MKDYYKILQVDSDASPAAITQAYRERVAQCHPNFFHTRRKEPMESRMRELNEAYQVLADPAARAGYDANLHTYRLSVRPVAPSVPPSPMRRFVKILGWFALFSLGLSLVRLLPSDFFLKDVLMSGLAFALFFCVYREYFPRRAG